MSDIVVLMLRMYLAFIMLVAGVAAFIFLWPVAAVILFIQSLYRKP